MSVFENVLVGAAYGGARRGREAHRQAAGALERCGMTRLADTPAGSLRLLDRKRLELARALATGPRLVLLDEIAGGLTDAELPELVALVADLRSSGLAVVWIEHIVHALLQVVDRLMCLALGDVVAIGDPHAVMREPPGGRGLPGLGPRRRGGRVSALLEVAGLDVHHGDLQALHGLDVSVSAGETLAVIGPTARGRPPCSARSRAACR